MPQNKKTDRKASIGQPKGVSVSGKRIPPKKLYNFD
nr:MAG TPA: hypothetical protein [Caudoviricetes sp.]